jgi:H+/gluconate symporter-like permease
MFFPFPLLAVMLTEPHYVLPFFSNIFMEKMVGFIKLYLPVFLLGAIFGKTIEMAGVAESIAKKIVLLVGRKRAILTLWFTLFIPGVLLSFLE